MMRRIGFRPAVLALLLLLAFGSAAEDRYRVTLRFDADDDRAIVTRQLAATYGVEVEPDGGEAATVVVRGSNAGMRMLRGDRRVIAVEAADPRGFGAYAYDGAGNVTQVGADTFAYDESGRLENAIIADVEQTFTYDRHGNITTIATTGENARTIGVDANNRLSGATYDASGNLVSYSGGTFVYDGLNVVKELTPTNGNRHLYLYSASNERIATIEFLPGGQQESDWTIRDDGGKVLRRYKKHPNGAWTWEEDYIYRGAQLLAAEVPGPEKVRHFHLDHLGTPRLITGNGGAILAERTYAAFGRGLLVESTPYPDEPAQFTGHERDNFQLDYMHARYYDPMLGRFLSVDPVCGLVDRPQSWNRYAYALNNPLMYTDPTGRYPCKIKLTGQDAKDARVDDGTEVDGECVDARDPAKEEEDKKRQQRPRPQVLPMLPFSPEPVRPDGPVTMLTRQLWDALDVGQAFLQNYLDMREAWTVGADRYFHCMANCKGARAGAYGSGISERFSNAREVWDQNVKRYPLSDSVGDQAANAAGRNGPLSLPCETVCAGFRPAALSSRY